MYRNAAGMVIRITGKRQDGRVSYEGVNGKLRGGNIPASYELFAIEGR